MPNFPVEVLWCANARQGNGNGWTFPPAVEKLLLRECAGATVLHPFGGRARFGIRMDIDPIVRPHVIADAWMPPFGRDSFDVVVLDPPYAHINANVKMALLRIYAWIAREQIVWFHTQWIGTFGGIAPIKSYLVRVGDHCHVRALQFFRPREPKKPVPFPFSRGPGIKYNRWIAGEMPLPFPEASAAQSKGKIPA
jgi:hypothetical protein